MSIKLTSIIKYQQGRELTEAIALDLEHQKAQLNELYIDRILIPITLHRRSHFLSKPQKDDRTFFPGTS